MWTITFLQKEQKPGLRPSKKLGQARLLRGFGGQVTIEITVAIMAIAVFFLGVMQLFIALNRSTIGRQKAYQNSRTGLGTSGSINFYDGTIHVFPEER